MPVTGLPQGFVAFDTVACRVLKALHVLKKGTQSDIMEEAGITGWQACTAIHRLRKHGFLHKIDTRCTYDVGRTEKTQWVYSLVRRGIAKKYKKATPAERTRQYRARKAMKATSVFNFRGEVKL
jgi:hypothetical protein